MDIEASVVERLQKLRQWQLEQQERLLKQQQIQRDMLTQKQDCMYKALELSIQELDLNEDTLNINNSNEIENNEINNKDLITLHNKSQIKESCMQMINDNISCISQNNNFENMILQQKSPTINFNDDIINIENHIKRQSKDEINSIISSEKEKQIEQFFIDGIAPLPPDKTVINHISIDDIPIFSPKKDFHTLLEEKLKDNNEIEPLIKSNTNSGNKIKKPFLRKGEGLTRFKLNQKSQLSTLKIRSRSASFNNKTQSGFKYSKNENKSNKITQDSKNAQLSKNIHCTNLAQKQLSLKNIPLPKKKIHSKSESNISSSHLKDYINEMKNTIELNSSDFHSGTHKELEEVRIFELLEEKAENSSFCSTSSTVTAFLQQSTPFKVKNAEYKTENNMKKTKQIIPINKVSKKQLDLKSSNQIFKCITSNKDMDDITHSDFISFENQKATHDNIYENIQHIDENNTMKTNEDGHILRNEIQSTYNEQNFCNVPVVEKNNEINDSLHVRFSEHNEYKTIGLTDTSSTSTESLATKCFFDDKLWSDSSILETESITETIPIAFNMSQPSITMKSKMQELNYKAQNCEDIKQDNNSICETNINQYVYHKDDLEISDTEDQTSNDETSNSYKNSQNNSKSQKNDNYNIKTLKYMKRYDNKEIDEYVNNCDNEKVTEYQENVEDLQETNGTIFKSELLKNRLLELEQEISIFRKENTALSMQRKKLHEDYKNLCKEYAQKEKNFEQNKKQVEERLQEEKKKLARQKAALENRMRDSQEKAQQSKLERQEIQNLKQEIIKLTEEMQIKESRWNAAESRYKCQMRILKRENSKLKQETERLQNLKKNDRNKGKFGTSANTRVIHQINKQLDMQFKESQKINDVLSQSDQKLVIKTITNDQNIEKGKEHNYNHNKNIINKSESQTITDAAKKRNLYENLIKEATSDLIEIQEQFNIPENLNKSESELSNKFKKLSNKTSKKSYEECDIFFNHNNQIEINEDNQIKNIQLHMQNDHTSLIPPMKTYNENYEKSLASLDKSNTCITTTSSNKTKQDTKQDVTQIEYFDGSIEYRFPNGNIKKIFPDQGVTKLIYYNGDMRETNKDGKIKYFYASTCTWHTTMPDGLEILEFSDGQIERRSQNGTVEVSFPDGSVRILESDGIEKWTLPDGTLIQILTNGEKILTLPNGQREIHTNTHKRREYPDGTVKLIYLDGTQETRYSNGRIRLKDKDGNLLMDSCQ